MALGQNRRLERSEPLDDLAVVLHPKTRIRRDADPACGVDVDARHLLRPREPGDDRGKQAGDVAGAHDRHLEQAVPRVGAVGHRQIELDATEVDQQDGDPVGGDALAVELELELRSRGGQVRDGGHEVGEGADAWP